MRKYLFWVLLIFYSSNAFAHPMPTSIINLSVLENFITGEAKVPLIELANAVGEQRVKNLPDPFFKTYFTEHIQAVSSGNKWTTTIESITLITGNDPAIGNFQEALVKFKLTPPDIRYLRTFSFYYDAVIHQVVTHSALIFIKQDWTNGIHGEENAQQIDVARTDIPTGKVFPIEINLASGSKWKGFSSMVALGIEHIKEGTDHLLFLLVLLLPAPLLVQRRRWSSYGGAKYSSIRILKIVTAFTIGHSITLLLGALGWVRLPSQPIEILIAFSILVSAIHAIKPLFPGKEIFVAAGFGLVHGLAFASTLASLELDAGSMALSILGFNIGIELMQLFVIAISFPWLIMLSRTKWYDVIRIGGASLAALAALAWMVQRITNRDNLFTTGVETVAGKGSWIVIALAVVALASFFWQKQSKSKKFT